MLTFSLLKESKACHSRGTEIALVSEAPKLSDSVSVEESDSVRSAGACVDDALELEVFCGLLLP